MWLQREVRVHIRYLAQLELSKWQPLCLLMAVFPRTCPVLKGDFILLSLFALQTEPPVGSCLVLCDFLKVFSGLWGKF